MRTDIISMRSVHTWQVFNKGLLFILSFKAQLCEAIPVFPIPQDGITAVLGIAFLKTVIKKDIKC